MYNAVCGMTIKKQKTGQSCAQVFTLREGGVESKEVEFHVTF